MLGSTPVTIEVGSVYTDAGATATDNYDLSVAVTVTGSVNAAVVGDYTLTYNAVDSNGNHAVPVTRIVHVVDSAVPVITLSGSTPVTIEVGSVYTDAGATATDNYDLSVAVTVTGSVNAAVVGDYTLTYNAVDSNGNHAVPVTRIVHVVDSAVPVITLSGSTPVTIEVGSVYTDAGATATDNYDLSVAVTVTGSVNAAVVGDYTLTYNAVDSNGNHAVPVTRIVHVVDSAVPVITLSGSTPVTIEVGSVYTDAGATATDNYDLSVAVTVTGSVNAAVVGDYTLTYNAVDSNGNHAVPVTRIVHVVDSAVPVITLSGSTPVTIEVGSVYTDAGATATDNYDLSVAVTVTGSVNAAVVGDYTLTYNAVDSNGNHAVPVTRIVHVVDSAVPVITLSGSTPVTIEVGSVYTDAGATATDNYDLSVAVTVTGSVNAAVVGDYTLTYNAVDSNGNHAVPVTRIVHVVDSAVPVITLSGSTPVTIEVGSVYTDAGATATDNYDLSVAVTVTGSVNAAVVGDYTLTYNAVDSNGNHAVPVTRIVHVVDSAVPVITLSGSTPVTIEVGSVYTDAGATATDNYDLSVAVTVTGSVNAAVVGDYTLTYNAVDSNGNHAVPVTRIVHVVDSAVPVITLSGSTPVTIEVGSVYTDAGATATDNYDLSVAVTVTGSVNAAVVGDYTLTYNAVDSNGNHAVPVTRIVHVVDSAVPVITLSGSTPVTIEVGSVYTDAGATATDNYDLSVAVTVTGSVNAAVVGDYTLTYNAVDSNGNHAVPVTRIVHVVDSAVPVITLSGSTPVTIEVGSVYTDAGATATDNYDLSVAVTVTGSVNAAVVGDYTLTYNAVDSNGNHAVPVTRIVHVVDSAVPVITLSGSTPVTIEVGSVYTDAGATATDNYDLSVAVTVTGSVNAAVVGDYTLTYNAVDSNGNHAVPVTRIVHVVDSAVPVITLSGSTPVTIEVGSVYTDAGATATDNYDLSVAVTVTGSVNAAVVGDYTLTYNAVDSNGNHAVPVTRIVHVVDSAVPVITLSGSTPVTIEVGSVYTDAGATATDNYDLSVAVTVTGSVNAAVVGDYTLTYNAVDSNGNHAVPVTRIVHVVDTTAPLTSDNYNGLWHTSDFTITLTAVDVGGISETYYKINGGTTMTVSANGQPLITTEGAANSLEYWSVDRAGNVEVHHTLLNIKLDKSDPTVAITSPINNAVLHSGSFTVSGTASDGAGVLKVQFKVGATGTYQDAATSDSWAHWTYGVSGLADGPYTIYALVTDMGGNTKETSVALTVQTTVTIVASAGSGGSISPSGSVSVTYGTDKTFIIAANVGYHIVDVVVDGVSKGVQASWTFVNVQTDTQLRRAFAINTYTITVTAGANGGISPGTGFVNYGATPTYTITPHVGYHIASITVNGLPVAVNTPAGQSYQFSAVSADGSIGATFAINTGSTGSADLVVRGADNTVYYRSYDFASDTWGGWVGLPGSTLDSPAAVVCGNELHIVVRGMDGESLYHGYVDLNSNVFSGWSWISGTTPSPPTLASNGNAVALVVRGADNSVYYCVYSVQARSWGDWRVFASGSTCDKVAAVMEGDVLTVVVRGYSASDLSAQNSLWQASVDVVSGVFSGWSWIPGVCYVFAYFGCLAKWLWLLFGC